MFSEIRTKLNVSWNSLNEFLAFLLRLQVWCSPQLRVKGGNAVRKAAGFQAALVCLPPAPPRPPDPAQPQQFNITALTINSSYGL